MTKKDEYLDWHSKQNFVYLEPEAEKELFEALQFCDAFLERCDKLDEELNHHKSRRMDHLSLINKLEKENAELKKENEKLLEHRRITSWNNHKILKMHTSMARNLRQENEAIMAINEKLLKEQTK